MPSTLEQPAPFFVGVVGEVEVGVRVRVVVRVEVRVEVRAEVRVVVRVEVEVGVRVVVVVVVEVRVEVRVEVEVGVEVEVTMWQRALSPNGPWHAVVSVPRRVIRRWPRARLGYLACPSYDYRQACAGPVYYYRLCAAAGVMAYEEVALQSASAG